LKSGNATVQYCCEKMLFLSFLISPGSAEALVRWGGKINYFLMVYCLSNIYAKKYLNRFMCVRVWCIFLVHGCTSDCWQSERHIEFDRFRSTLALCLRRLFLCFCWLWTCLTAAPASVDPAHRQFTSACDTRVSNTGQHKLSSSSLCLKKGYHPTTNDNFNSSCPIPVIFCTNIAE